MGRYLLLKPHLFAKGRLATLRTSKQNPSKVNKIHDIAVEDSMAVSDPSPTIMLEVKN